MSVKNVAVLTSGGDAPGMNAAIRAVVRTAHFHDMKACGIRHAFKGLVDGDIDPLMPRDVSGIIERGGTRLQTVRYPEFEKAAEQKKGLRSLNKHNIESLIVIGGNGSMKGALAMHRLGFPTVGIPASIDNDIWGTAMSLGVDTALNTILRATDALRDTAASHERVFLVEVMGRSCGYLAMVGGVLAGAEFILVPEIKVTLEEVIKVVEDAYLKGKTHALVMVAEGANLKVRDIAEALSHHDIGFEVRVVVLGHLQRGGSPTAFDRSLATQMGVEAVNVLREGKSGVMVALEGRDVSTLPLEEVVTQRRELSQKYLEMERILAR
jgi:6-phosphofructokinase 1